jgi:hypothetical protein
MTENTSEPIRDGCGEGGRIGGEAFFSEFAKISQAIA